MNLMHFYLHFFLFGWQEEHNNKRKAGKIAEEQQITSEIAAFDSYRISIIRGVLFSAECGRQFALLLHKLQTLQIC